MSFEEDVVVELSSLLPDEAGEVVLFAGYGPVCLQSDSPVIASGVADDGRLTAAGDDVSGLRFSHFANGLTVYHSEEVLQIDAPALVEM